MKKLNLTSFVLRNLICLILLALAASCTTISTQGDNRLDEKHNLERK